MQRERIAMISREVHRICKYDGCNLGCKYRHLKPDCVNYAIADCMLSQRVVIPPCKVGDILYQVTRNFVSEFKVRFIEISTCGNVFLHTDLISGIILTGEIFNENEIGKTIFLSKEEAIKTLKTEKNVI